MADDIIFRSEIDLAARLFDIRSRPADERGRISLLGSRPDPYRGTADQQHQKAHGERGGQSTIESVDTHAHEIGPLQLPLEVGGHLG